MQESILRPFVYFSKKSPVVKLVVGSFSVAYILGTILVNETLFLSSDAPPELIEYSLKGNKYEDGWLRTIIKIKHPTELQYDQNGNIEVEIEAAGPGNHILYDQIPDSTVSESKIRDILLICFGANFIIDPSKDIRRSTQMPMPLKWIWNVSSSKQGRQLITIDFQDLALSQYGTDSILIDLEPKSSIIINGLEKESIKTKYLTQYPLEINITGKFGMTRGQTEVFDLIIGILSYLGGIAAFIITILIGLPYVSGKLNRKIEENIEREKQSVIVTPEEYRKEKQNNAYKDYSKENK